MVCQRIFVLALAINFASAFVDLNIMNCLRENNLMDFVQLLKDSNQNQQLTGDGKFFFTFLTC